MTSRSLQKEVSLNPFKNNEELEHLDIHTSMTCSAATLTLNVPELECCKDEILRKDKKEHSTIQRCFNIDVENDPSFKGPDACYPFTR